MNYRIGVIGLGYVGLPLAVEFGKKYPVVGFDISSHRVQELSAGIDSTLEVSEKELNASPPYVTFTDNLSLLDLCNVYIVTVPTPVDSENNPDLIPLKSASETVACALKKGDIVIYESTVFPGCTEDVCVPVLEQVSGLKFNQDFFVGYSPERINPGDKNKRLPDIMKVTSGSTPEIAEKIDALYKQIITAGTFKATSIKVAEASKIIENIQRDTNIALMNELAIIFDKIGIDTSDVLDAASTKWNFLRFEPGLVGGHCIGVDPYYMIHKANSVGYSATLIETARKTNNYMATYIVERLVRDLIERRIGASKPKVLVLGLTFKENCPDLRNSKVSDIIFALQALGYDVDCFDPWVSAYDVKREYGIDMLDNLPSKKGTYDAIVLAVGHDDFRVRGAGQIRALGNESSLFYDLKGTFAEHQSDFRL